MKKIKYSLNEADMSQLKDAIANKIEFIEDDVQSSLVGNDIVISVFNKVVLILVGGETPFIIEREDMSPEEQDIVNEMYDALNIEIENDGDDEPADDDFDGDDDLGDDEPVGDGLDDDDEFK